MTEPTAVEAELRRTFAAVAEATPLTDRDAARAELLAALGASEPPPRRAGRPVRLLPVAAALLLVGAAVVGLALRGGDDTEHAGPGGRTGPVDDPGLDTGWYLPGEGWTITEVSADDLGPGCACPQFVAARPGDDDPAAVVVTEYPSPRPVDDTPPSDPRPVDVGGREGFRDDDVLDHLEGADEGIVGLKVDSSGRRVRALARGIAVGDLAALLDAWADAIDAGRAVVAAELPLPEGFVRTPVQPSDGEVRTLLYLATEQDGTGAGVEYQIVPAGIQQRRLLLVADTIEVGAPGTLLFDGVISGDLTAGAVGGPVDVTAGYRYSGDGPADLDHDELLAYLDALHEVDTATWGAALPSGALADLLRGQPTLFDRPTGG